MLRKLVVSFCSLLLLASSSIGISQAQEEASPSAEEEVIPPAPSQAINISVSPVRLIFDTEPESTTTQNVKIRNNGIESEYLEADVMTFDMVNGEVQIRDFNQGENFEDWISFSEERFQVRPGEWKTITVEFAPPDFPKTTRCGCQSWGNRSYWCARNLNFSKRYF